MEVRNINDCMIPIDKLMPKQNQKSKLARGVLYREDRDQYGRKIFHKVAENTVVLGGAIAALERLTNKTASFRPNTLNQILNLNTGYDYHVTSTPIALFGCGVGGASMTFGDVYDPSVKQNNVASLLPMMVSENELTGIDAAKYMMRTTVSTPGGTSLNCWYLKEFDIDPVITSLWKDAADEDDDGTEITEDISESTSENGVESFAQFKLVLRDDDIRSYYKAMGTLPQARFNTIGLFVGEKVTIGTYEDYVNVSLFSVVNFNNEALAERKEVSYMYRVYSLI